MTLSIPSTELQNNRSLSKKLTKVNIAGDRECIQVLIRPNCRDDECNLPSTRTSAFRKTRRTPGNVNLQEKSYYTDLVLVQGMSSCTAVYNHTIAMTYHLVYMDTGD